MANRRFIDFPIAASVGDNDIVLILQDGLNKQTTKATLLQGSPQSLAGLTDVDIAGLTNGQILQYNSTLGKWENVDRTDINLSELGDVTIVAPTNGQVLVYNSSTSKWENSSGGYVPYTGAVTTVNLGAQTIQAGSFVKAGGTSSQFLKANGSVDSTAYGTGTVTSVALTMPSAFSVGGSPVTTAGTLAVTGAGTVGQYIRGDGSLADFPESSGGGSSVSYYLNGSVNQGTIGGIAYKELSKVPILGAGTDFTINANGYIASFITDAGDPNLLEIPGGNWNLETYFSASSGGGSPTFYVELYKVNSGGTATLIASNSGSPELIAFGTNLTAYFSSLAVPTTTLALTDRLAIRYYVTHSGRTITMHTENNHLCQIITTFTTGLTALNGLTAQVQNFATGTTGTDFNIASATATHTFNLPTASGTNRGALSSTDWTTFNNKENAITSGTTAQYFRGDKTFQTLNTSVVPEGTNLYYTEARVNANTNVAANTAARHNAVTLGTANGLSLSTQVLSLGLASAGVTGALSGTDWSTFNNKQNALTNPVTGTGTTNYLAKFTGTTTVGNSQVFDNGTNVLIGTTTDAGFKLDVNGTGRFGGIITTTSSGIASGNFGGNAASWEGNSGYPTLFGSSADRWIMHINPHISYTQNGVNGFAGSMTGATLRYASNPAAASYWDIGVGTNSVGADKMSLGRAGVNFLAITNAGNIGIGTATPNDKFHVVGGIYSTSLTTPTNTNIGAIQIGYDGTNGVIRTWNSSPLIISNFNYQAFETSGSERFRISSTGFVSAGAVTNGRLGVRGFTNDSSGYAFEAANASGNTLFIVRNDGVSTFTGNVGIGTYSPSYTLQSKGTGFAVQGYNLNQGNTIRFLRESGTEMAYIGWTNEATNNSTWYFKSTNGNPIGFSADGTTQQLTLTYGGNVLVGTTTDVGNIRLQVAASASAWISQTISGSGGTDKVVIGNYNGLASIGGHNAALNAWATLALNFDGGNVLIGTQTDNGNKLRVNGVGFFDQGVRTGQPVGTTTNNWLLGRALASGTSTPNRWIRVQIGLEYYDILAVYMGTL